MHTPAVAILLLAPALAAQAQFRPLGKEHWLQLEVQTARTIAGDVDGDGDADLISQEADGANPRLRLYRNVGNAVFQAPAQAFGLAHGELVLFDADGDRDPDLFTPGFAGSAMSYPAALWLNDGSGGFALAGGRVPASTRYDVAVADVDRDGDLDLLLGGVAPVALWLNDGRGTFADATAARMPGTPIDSQALAVADIDRDGDPDLLVGWAVGPDTGRQGVRVVFVNDGGGTFVDGSEGRFPDRDALQRCQFADLDGDGAPDLLGIDAGWQPRAYRNDGLGRFVRLPLPAGGAFAVGAADFDLDRDVDLVVGDVQPRLLLNDGIGRFTAAPGRLPWTLGSTGLHAVADVEGDGDLDLVVAENPLGRLLLNDGTGTFLDATGTGLPGMAAARFADLDGDGNLDVVRIFSDGGLRLGVALGDGAGGFTPVAPGSLPVDPEVGGLPLVPFDVDNDRDADLVFAGVTVSGRVFPKLYRNDGRARFTDVTATQMANVAGYRMAADDVDGDADVDLVVADQSGASELLRNDGRGTFTVAVGQVPPGNFGTTSVLLADLDRDGDLDLVIGRADYSVTPSRSRLLRNDGTGRFTEDAAALPSSHAFVSAVVAGDVDGDGDLDLALGAWGTSSYPEQINRLYMNDGAGRFTDVSAQRLPGGTAANEGPDSIDVGDVDDDGDLDLVAGFYNAGRQLLLNDGRGVFTAAPSRIAAGWSTRERFVDVDQDGDLDLYEGSMQLNLHRQCHAPYLARAGRPYVVRMASQPGYGAGPRAAIPVLGSAPASVLLPPFGRLGIDLGTAVVLPAVSLDPATGEGTLAFTLPPASWIVGQSLYTQALVVSATGLPGARFTNVVRDRIGN